MQVAVVTFYEVGTDDREEAERMVVEALAAESEGKGVTQPRVARTFGFIGGLGYTAIGELRGLLESRPRAAGDGVGEPPVFQTQVGGAVAELQRVAPTLALHLRYVDELQIENAAPEFGGAEKYGRWVSTAEGRPGATVLLVPQETRVVVEVLRDLCDDEEMSVRLLAMMRAAGRCYDKWRAKEPGWCG